MSLRTTPVRPSTFGPFEPSPGNGPSVSSGMRLVHAADEPVVVPGLASLVRCVAVARRSRAAERRRRRRRAARPCATSAAGRSPRRSRRGRGAGRRSRRGRREIGVYPMWLRPSEASETDDEGSMKTAGAVWRRIEPATADEDPGRGRRSPAAAEPRQGARRTRLRGRRRVRRRRRAVQGRVGGLRRDRARRHDAGARRMAGALAAPRGASARPS